MLEITETRIVDPDFHDCICGEAVDHKCKTANYQGYAQVKCPKCGLGMSDYMEDYGDNIQLEALYMRLCNKWNNIVGKADSPDYTKDIEGWSDALNDAGWTFIESYRQHIGEIPTKLFNCTKSLLRESITKYIETMEKNHREKA